MKRVLVVMVVVVLCGVCRTGVGCAYAQTSLVGSDLSVPSLVSPYYFGPNAFAIPDMLDGTTDRHLRVELAVDHFVGFEQDRTTDIAAKVTLPLFTERVNLTLWMPVMEWWENSLSRQHTCRLQDTVQMRGHGAGDVYVSTDMWLLQSSRHWLDLSLRAAMKTASGGGFSEARYYDCPGYFFDATVAKPIVFTDSFFEELRIAASGGFLCWQTNNGRQNDAVMYGVMLKLRMKYLTLSETFGGYVGWEKGASKHPELYAGDSPMSLKTQLTAHYKHWEVQAMYQYGLQDWPFHQVRVGVAYNFEVLAPSNSPLRGRKAQDGK